MMANAKCTPGPWDCIAALEQAGFVDDGETRSETVRIGTTKSPILNRGKSGGEIRTFGGRKRLKLPGTQWKVTVGKRTVCFYKTPGPTDFQTFEASDPRAVHEAAIAKATGAA